MNARTDIKNDPADTRAGLSEETIPFECSMCGECCSSINIPIEAEKAEYLLEQKWVKTHLEKHHRTLIQATKTLYRLPLNDENNCVFLDEDKACLIQKNEGFEKKPQDCMTFPFAGLTLSNGEVVYDTSASCNMVANQLLLAFKTIVPNEGHNPTIHDVVFPQKVKARLFKKMSLADYKRYLFQLKQLWQTDGESIETLLKQTQGLINEGNVPKKATFKISDWKKKLALLVFLRTPYGTMTRWNYLLKNTYDDPRVFGVSVDLAGLETVVMTDAGNPYIRAFLFNMLSRKALITYGHSLQSILGMATVASILVGWYARVLALIDGRTEATVDDVTLAIRLTERYYSGHQPRFPEFFRMYGQYGIQKFLLG